MSEPQLQVTPLGAALGAEVSGIDLSKPLERERCEQLQAAWLRHQVLFFRDQDIDIEQHKEFARNFGELHVHPVLQQMADQGHPEVVVLESDEQRPFVADGWHSDVTFEREPPLGSILHGVTVPDVGGDTLWASMYSAYEALSDAMQRLLSGLSAWHSGEFFQRVADNDSKRSELAKNEKTVHPVIRTHPETGRKVLFVNSAFTRSIEGMKPAESQALLGFLYRHIESPEFSCRFRWRSHSIAMWDNRCTQHRVVSDNLSAHRRMQRLTLKGDAPF